MASYRPVSSKFWVDGYIRTINPLERYLFLYCLTNPHTNLVGIYEAPMDLVANETGIEERTLREVMFPKLEPKIFYREGWIFVPNYQKYHKQGSELVLKGIEREKKDIPARITAIFDELLTGRESLSEPIGGLSHSDLDLDSDFIVQAKPGEPKRITIDSLEASPRAIPKGPPKPPSRWNRQSEDDVPTIDVDTGEEPVEETQLSARQPSETSMANFYKFKAYFVNEVNRIKGFEPVVSRGDYVLFMKARKKYGPEELQEIVSIFLEDPKSDEHTTLAACFSNDSLTNFARMRSKR